MSIDTFAFGILCSSFCLMLVDEFVCIHKYTHKMPSLTDANARATA